MAQEHGKFVWYELMTSDMAAAEAFYKKVVGWDAADAGMEGMTYTLFSADGRPVAGSMDLPDTARDMGVPPMWLGYIAVSDVDATAADIVTAGGVIHRPAADIPNIGRFAIVGDPQGAAFALFKAKPGEQPPPPVAPQTAGHVGWHELYAGDGETAFAFYSKMFGWEKHRDMDMGAMGVYRIFGRDGVDTGGMMTKPPGMPAAAWTFYFNVPAIDAAGERVKAAGGQVLNGPMEVPGGQWIIQCLDPQGAMFALVAPGR
jgi:predicted enzyme related to lactoylglutathione lyase